MANLSGVLVSSLISLSSVPLVILVTDHPDLSEPFNMMVIGFSLLLAIGLSMRTFLPPSAVKEHEGLEGRGFLYYISCLFMWASVADLTIQSRHLQVFGNSSSTQYFDHGEPYLATPLGITAQFWNGIVNSLLYLIIIYQIDNYIDCRNTALYWCGGILTSQFVVVGGALSGSFSDQLQYSVWMNAVFVLFPLWVFYYFRLKPRFTSRNFHLYIENSNKKKTSSFEMLLVAGLLAASLFSFFRGLASLNSNFPVVKYYIVHYEPYIVEPSRFGSMWCLYTAVYGIPFQLSAIHGLLRGKCEWMIDMSIFYSAGMLQGTFAFLVYSWFPSSDPKYRIPDDSLIIVLFLNISMVIIANLLMLRCLYDQSSFIQHPVDKSSKQK